MRICFFPVLLVLITATPVLSQDQSSILLFSADAAAQAGNTRIVFHPLQELVIVAKKGSRLVVTDASGKPYYSHPLPGEIHFAVRGALGEQTVAIYDGAGRLLDRRSFPVDAQTTIDDGGYYKAMFNLFYKGMCVYSPGGVESMDINGQPVQYFVPWGLDNFNTLKGMQYFSKAGPQLTDIFASHQRDDGMIWSFVAANKDNDYFKTAYSPFGFYKEDGNVYFVRQPVENHVEYIFVNTIYKCWKASGDSSWMRNKLDNARRALDYSIHDRLRWSSTFGLLKRGFTIDSWDFQVNDKYTAQLGLGNAMLVDSQKTRFGIFYGDNTGYAQACRQLAEMYETTGDTADANRYRQRSVDILQRLNRLCWNGHFYTHFIDEDSAVHRDLGVDLNSQLSQSNAYSLNRGLSYEQDTAILESYKRLRQRLPEGAPAEWYSIYPPFQRGFGEHNAIWQYMNGGVGGHVAGELALGAFNNGFEAYGMDILDRLYQLGNRHGHRIYFAYTGAFPPPLTPIFHPLDIRSQANMGLRSGVSPGVIGFLGDSSADGNDLSKMPVGRQLFAGLPFDIIDPMTNGGRAMLSVSNRAGYPSQLTIAVNDTAACIHLLHDASGSDDICASVTLVYTDSTRHSEYIVKGKHLAGWWFPNLTRDHAGVAWSGPNAKSSRVGAYWAAIANPTPQKPIREIVIRAADNNSIYGLLAVTLASLPHYVRPPAESFGGPDNWAAATAMAALIEGLAGVTDRGVAFRQPVIAPKWTLSASDSIEVTVRYAASSGYVSYRLYHNPARRIIRIMATGSAPKFLFHLLLPGAGPPPRVTAGRTVLSSTTSTLGSSHYVDFEADGSDEIKIAY